MTTPARRPVEEYLAMHYPFTVSIVDGDYFVEFPDLPGCMTDAERIEDLPARIEEVRQLWIEVSYEQGQDIPLPSQSLADGHTIDFVSSVPKSLHRQLAEAARREGVSLNQYVVALLAAGNAAGSGKGASTASAKKRKAGETTSLP